MFLVLISLKTRMNAFWYSMISSMQSMTKLPSGNSLPPKIDSRYGWSKIEKFVTFVFTLIRYVNAVSIRNCFTSP